MTVADARKVLEDKIITWASAGTGERLRDGGAFFQAAIDAFAAAAVRAETLAPATRGQSAGLEGAEAWLRVGVPDGFTVTEALNMSTIATELDCLRAAIAAAEAENAELRKLCGRAAMWIRIYAEALIARGAPGVDMHTVLAPELEAAARRAWK